MLKHEGKIETSTYSYLHSVDAVLLRTSEKINDQGFSIRTIVSFANAPTYMYNLSKLIADILRPLVGNSTRSVKNF